MLKCLPPRLAPIDLRRAKPPAKVADGFYLGRDWKRLRAEVVHRRGRRCEECGATGVRVFADHVVEIQDGGSPLDEANIRVLCGSCHTAKTNAERAKRQRA